MPLISIEAPTKALAMLIPMTAASIQIHGVRLLGPEVSVTMEQPTTYKSQQSDAADWFAWTALANEAFKNSRPMKDWERKVTSEFFWSQFQ